MIAYDELLFSKMKMQSAIKSDLKINKSEEYNYLKCKVVDAV